MTREETLAGAFAAIQSGSKSFRAASRLFDRQTRERAWLLYCWCRHCDDVCDGQTLGSGAGERSGSVRDLRQKTQSAAADLASDELPFEALRVLLAECPIPRQYLDDHVDGFALDEEGWAPTTATDLERYCYHVAGAVGCMMAIVMGVPPDDAKTLERAAALGMAFQLSNIARDLHEDLANGRCYVPEEWLREFGIGRSDLFQPRHQDGLLKIVDRLVEGVERYETIARRGVPQLPFRSRWAVLTAGRIYGAIGRRVRALGTRAWDRRVTVGKAEKLRLLVPSFADAIALRPR